jgi:flagella basal body P-ring formation protein FlgA
MRKVNVLLGRIAIISFLATLLSIAYAQEGDPIATSVNAELSKRFPHARVELTDEIHWTSSRPEGEISSIRVGEENARAQVGITVETRDEQGSHRGYGYATFAAWIPARMAVRRVLPGEKLQDEQFSVREINVASGVEREIRGVILDQGMTLSQLQARQTVLEGQPLLSSAVEKIPDVRRGDLVRVRIVSNGLTLSTQAIASEPGYLNNSVRVLTEKTKRELSGKLIASGIVEVRL